VLHGRDGEKQARSWLGGEFLGRDGEKQARSWLGGEI
jgi:hypothetical protein